MHVYCSGVGGIGMSYVARYLHAEGHKVTGVDAADRDTMAKLRDMGMEMYVGHDHPVPEDVDLVLASPAVLIANPVDIRSARERGVPVKTWQEYLGTITKKHDTVAICGTHGKSTTTAMLGVAMQELQMDPTVMVGTMVPAFDHTNLRLGKAPWLILEADEFHENFLSYTPKFILCTGVEPDHLDYFKSEDKYRMAFINFFMRLPKDGAVFYHAGDTSVEDVITRAGVRGIPIEMKNIPLKVPGLHNRANATLVAGFLEAQGSAPEQAIQALQHFTGTWRRQEHVGSTSQGAQIYDDYAHHPTEIKATLSALREAHPHAELVAVFQPHQYSRTRLLFDDFAGAFCDADKVYLMDIYESRDTEEDKKAVSSEQLAKKIREYGLDVETSGNVEHTKKLLQDMGTSTKERVIVCMGAGSITEVARFLTS